MPLEEDYVRGYVIKMSAEIAFFSTTNARSLHFQSWNPISQGIRDDHSLAQRPSSPLYILPQRPRALFRIIDIRS
jgi:hypothetical protein